MAILKPVPQHVHALFHDLGVTRGLHDDLLPLGKQFGPLEDGVPPTADGFVPRIHEVLEAQLRGNLVVHLQTLDDHALAVVEHLPAIRHHLGGVLEDLHLLGQAQGGKPQDYERSEN